MYCGDTARYYVNALTDLKNQNIELKSELETLREEYVKFKMLVTDEIAELKAVVSAVNCRDLQQSSNWRLLLHCMSFLQTASALQLHFIPQFLYCICTALHREKS